MHNRRRHRHSLRRRIAVAFVLVALATIMITFHAGFFGGGVRGPFGFRWVFIALPVAAVIGVATAGLVTRRLSRLRHAVERLNPQDLALRVPVEGEDEVAALADAFNRMLGRLEAAERVRREFFADVAHELRHPLSVLKGRLEMMQDGLLELSPEQVLALQDTVLALGRLVDDVRDLSLAEVGRLSLNLTDVNVGELIGDLQEYLEPMAASKGVALTAQAAQDLPAVTADRDRIRQVLLNLLVNALRYTPEGGRVEARAWAEGGEVFIQVADTGAGIAPADLPHIFDRFYRADKSRERTTGGTGLGLAIVRSLVDLHGGSVRAESEPGKGSRFTVALPRRQPSQRA